jgi:iron complex outermembrane receptor protein
MALAGRFCVAFTCIAGSAWYPATAAPPPTGAQSKQLSAQEAGDVLENVIVTARRREEELQQAPVSVVSLSAADLEARSITNLQGLQYSVPNLTFAPSQNVGDAAGNIFIRGIGQEDFVAGTEGGVGLYLDGVYIARSMGSLMNLLDIRRIEVLRGPQGTLYGKNAIGGAINIQSVAPDAEQRAYADLIAGETGRLDLRAVLNVPLTNSLFVRVAGGRFSRDGYLQRLRAPFTPTDFTETNGDNEGRDDSAAGRLQVRWLVSPSMTIDLAADASRRRGSQAATHVDAFDPRSGILPDVNALVRNGKLPGPEISNALVSDDLFDSHAGGNNSIDQDLAGVAATLTEQLGFHTLKLVTAYRGLRSHVMADLDGTWYAILQSDFREHHHQFSAELQASGTAGRLTYSAGLFALWEGMSTTSGKGISRADVRYLCDCFYNPSNRPVLTFTRRDQTGNSYATYGQVDVRWGHHLTTTIGARFSNEAKSTDVELVKLDPDTFEDTGHVFGSGSNDARWNAFTWRAGVAYQARPDFMLYASVAKGYKSGGFNTRPVSNRPNLGINEFAPERALAYEAGIRSEWFGRRLRVNATIFQTGYRDMQLRQQTVINNVVTTLIDNAARARIRGIEVEAATKLGDRLVASLAYGHLDPRYLDVERVPNVTVHTELQRTPHNSFTASLDYAVPLHSTRLALHADYGFRSREQFQFLASAYDQPAYGLFSARVTLRDESDRWSLAMFGSNLTDERYRTAGRGTGLSDVGIANSVIGPPRQLGVEFKAGF